MYDPFRLSNIFAFQDWRYTIFSFNEEREKVCIVIVKTWIFQSFHRWYKESISSMIRFVINEYFQMTRFAVKKNSKLKVK
jgi:hypothetical protein